MYQRRQHSTDLRKQPSCHMPVPQPSFCNKRLFLLRRDLLSAKMYTNRWTSHFSVTSSERCNDLINDRARQHWTTHTTAAHMWNRDPGVLNKNKSSLPITFSKNCTLRVLWDMALTPCQWLSYWYHGIHNVASCDATWSGTSTELQHIDNTNWVTNGISHRRSGNLTKVSCNVVWIVDVRFVKIRSAEDIRYHELLPFLRRKTASTCLAN